MPEMPKFQKFLLTVDDVNKELYILHREYPACLFWIKQETPVRFIILDLYDDVDDPNSIISMPFIEEAKAFWRKHANNVLNKN